MPRKAKPAADPLDAVNAEQAQALQSTAPAPPESVDVGELEERLAEADDRAAAAERRNEELAGEMKLLQEQIRALASARHPVQGQATTATIEDEEEGEPVFNEDAPYGTVIGDEQASYVQGGHQFGPTKQYLRTETHRGAGRPFNPGRVGWVKPRQNAVDPLDGIRGKD